MRNLLRLLFGTVLLVTSACSPKEPSNHSLEGKQNELQTEQKVPADFVLVKGGTFINTKSNLYEKRATLPDFYISKYEVTQKEWAELMGSNPATFKGDLLPVETVSWYDCVDYCNKRSAQEGLTPYYTIDKDKKDPINKNELDDIRWTVSFNTSANGYRLPTEAEWEYAAGGGHLSRSYTYSGGDTIDAVSWYWQNSGDKPLAGIWSWPALEKNHNQTKPIGKKNPNELGLYDMSGNVREWCEDWYEDPEMSIGMTRVWRGGGWMGADISCTSSFRGSHDANGKGSDHGLRLCRNL